MAQANLIVLMGNLCKEPNLRYTPSGKPICDLLIATNRKSGTADFIPVIVWGSDAEACGEFLKKGSLVHVTGRIQSRNYEKPEQGTKHVAIEVVVQEIEFLKEAPSKALINSVFLLGNLCKPPNLRFTPAGKAITDLLIATNRKSGAADYLPTIVWGKDAEACEDYLQQGSLVHIHGRLQSRNYEKPDGTKHVAIEVVSQEIEFLDKLLKQPEEELKELLNEESYEEM